MLCALKGSCHGLECVCSVLQYLLSSLLPVSSLQVSITPEANPTAGQSYTFICTVTPQGGHTGTPTVQWRGPGSYVPITTGGDITVSSTPPYTFTINPLRQSHAGEYTCKATSTIGRTVGSSTAVLIVEGN